MTIESNLTMTVEMESLLKFIEGIKEKPPEEQLRLIEEHIREALASAKSGWR